MLPCFQISPQYTHSWVIHADSLVLLNSEVPSSHFTVGISVHTGSLTFHPVFKINPHLLCSVTSVLVSSSPSVHGLLQVRTLEWAAMPSSRGSSPPREGTLVSHIAGRFFTSWATREAQTVLGTWNSTTHRIILKGKDPDSEAFTNQG